MSSKWRPITAKGVSFEWARDADGKLHVRRNGNTLTGHLEQHGEQFRVSFIHGKSFENIRDAIARLAYWYTFPEYKKPLLVDNIEWPDGTISKALPRETDDPLQITIWQTEIKIETARQLVDRLPAGTEHDSGKNRVYRAEIGLSVHRAIELMLKIPLGIRSDGWAFQRRNYGHWVSILHDRVEAMDSRITDHLDHVFQQTVMRHGDPMFGNFGIPFELKRAMVESGVRMS